MLDILVTSGYIEILFIPIEYYTVRKMEVFVMGNLHIFGNDNWKCNSRICCSSIGIMIGNENIKCFGLDNGSIYNRYFTYLWKR